MTVIHPWHLTLGLGAMLALVAPPVPAQGLRSSGAAAADTFAELHLRLEQAADEQLQSVAQEGRRAPAGSSRRLEVATKQSMEVGTLGRAFPLRRFSPSAQDSGLSGFRAAGAVARLRELGVDAGRIFAEEGVPLELLSVAGVESAFNPNAVSYKGAAGLWQLMPETAARFGLRIQSGADDRFDPLLSTRAAARYLRSLFFRFGDWALALAAYNAGEGAVQRGIDRGGTHDFWRLRAKNQLPRETRAYVPAVLAGTELPAGSKLLRQAGGRGHEGRGSGQLNLVYAEMRAGN